MKPAVRKVLIIRLSSIGDIVLTTPVVRCIRKQFPSAEIHYLTKSRYAMLIEANPYIDRIWRFDDNLGELIALLKKEKFSFIVDLHRNLRSHYLRLMIAAPGATFPKLNLLKWLIVNLKINRLPEVHIVDRYFRACAPLRVKNDGQGLDYFIPAGSEVKPEELPPAHREGFVAVVTGGKHGTKIFPAGKIIEVCRELKRPVVILGGPEDRHRGEEVAASLGPMIFNACGKFDLNQSASLIRQSLAVLTNDTGLMHIAAAFRKPIVSVWGNTIPAFGMYPYMPGKSAGSYLAEVSGLGCRPCSKLGYERCPRQHFRCMNDIGSHEIAITLQRMINKQTG